LQKDAKEKRERQMEERAASEEGDTQGQAPSMATWPYGLKSQIRPVNGLMYIDPVLKVLKEHKARACQY